MLGRGSIRRGLVVPVAPARLAALTKDKLLAVFGEVGDGFQIDPLVAALGVHRLGQGGCTAAVHHRAGGDFADDLLAGSAGFAGAAAGFAVFSV